MNKRLIYSLVLLALSIFVIFYNFPNYPKNIAHDETEIVRAALTLVNKPYTVFTPIADGHTTLYLYKLLGSFNIFGFNNFAMRLPVAVCSVVNVLLFYFILIKALKENKYRFEITLLSAMLMLTSHWFVNFARFSFEIPFLLTLELVSLCFLFVTLERSDRVSALSKKDSIVPRPSGILQNDIHVILSAIFAGLAFNSYQPGRIFFIVPLFYLLANKYYKQATQFLIVFGIVILPLSLYLLTNTANDVRINQQLYLSNNKLSVEQKMGYFSQNVIKNLGVFSFVGDGNGRHNYPGKPAINPILATFMYLGIFLSLLNIRKNNFHRLFLVYFLVGIFPTLLTLPNENPNMLRTYTILPSMFYFIVISLNTLFHIKEKGWMKYQPIIILTVLVLLAFSTYKELNTYFVDQGPVFNKAFEYSKSIDQIYKYK
jgi:4-amino-4-deoxy-L-arabinose transferase-like glycosyltransferase